MKINIWIPNFPLSPSQNACLRPSMPRPGKPSRLVKSKEYQLYTKRVHVWHMRHHLMIREVSEKLQNLVAHDPTLLFKVDFYFYFQPHRIISKKGIPLLKRNDTDNFVKPTTDALVSLLGIDDSLFWSRTAVKIPHTNPNETELTVIHISDYRIGQDDPLSELKAKFQQGGKNGKAGSSGPGT